MPNYDLVYKIAKCRLIAEHSDDQWVKSYWTNVADELELKYGTIQ